MKNGNFFPTMRGSLRGVLGSSISIDKPHSHRLSPNTLMTKNKSYFEKVRFHRRMSSYDHPATSYCVDCFTFPWRWRRSSGQTTKPSRGWSDVRWDTPTSAGHSVDVLLIEQTLNWIKFAAIGAERWKFSASLEGGDHLSSFSASAAVVWWSTSRMSFVNHKLIMLQASMQLQWIFSVSLKRCVNHKSLRLYQNWQALK